MEQSKYTPSPVPTGGEAEMFAHLSFSHLMVFLSFRLLF